MKQSWSEIIDGMAIDWQVPVPMPDGAVLRADVYRPVEQGRYPVVLSHGVYAKGLPFNGSVYQMQCGKLLSKDPSVKEESTNKYQAWEVVDPERWVPHGYVVVRVDSRGAGWSPGFLDPRSPQEYDDVSAGVEWAGTQDWSNGKVGIAGISYYTVMGWAAAARQPDHLAALIAWEGFNDQYRDAFYHGGILSEFTRRWQPNQINPIQYGQGERAPHQPEYRFAGSRTVDALRRGAGGAPERLFRDHQAASALRRMAPRAKHRPVQGRGPFADRRQLGRARHPSPRQLQRLHIRSVTGQMARGSR
ncbi:MAG TPA: CocE/NonD family hydrolase [Acidimicrobiia bacterium]|nr:CocE/NonD family hydrolase [Acidimicrobiia bacterium]